MTPLLLQIDPHQHLWNSYLKPRLHLPAAGFQLNPTLDHKLYRNHSTAQIMMITGSKLTIPCPECYSSSLASLIEEKNKILCEGIYEYFSSKYGTRDRKIVNRKKKCSKGKSLSKLRTERNKLRTDLRKAKKNGTDLQAIREISKKFHQLLRQHNKESKAQSCFDQKLRNTGKTAPKTYGGLPHKS